MGRGKEIRYHLIFEKIKGKIGLYHKIFMYENLKS